MSVEEETKRDFKKVSQKNFVIAKSIIEEYLDDAHEALLNEDYRLAIKLYDKVSIINQTT